MSDKWLNLFLHFSGYIFNLKQKIVEAKGWLSALPYVLILLLVELFFVIVSLPLYFVVSPKKLQERGLIFPSKEKENTHFQIYVVRRRISLTTIFSAGGIFLLKFIFVGVVSSYLLGAQALLAATQNWDFNTASDYTYDSSKIEVTGGVAKLVDQGGGGSCGGTATTCNTFITSPTCAAQSGCSWGGGASGATTNPSFDMNSTGWTYADWEDGARASGSRITTGGNPNGYINISISRSNSASTASGYWQQPFTTTVANPTSATVNFDWKIVGYNGTFLTSYIIYVFVENTSGAPTIGNEVWSQTVTGVTGWASVTNLDVSSKLTSAGTYYIKLVARRIKPIGNPPTTLNTVGWDNVSLNWSKTNSCSGTATVCTGFASSPTCAAQGGCAWAPVAVYPTSTPAIYPNTSLAPVGVTSWNAFTETATKGTGEIYYQLSDDDGLTWKYWDGASWSVISVPANYNTASVVNTHINSFSTTAGKIKWQAFLASNGSQQIILDNVAIGYIQNSPPSVQSMVVSQNVDSGKVNINYNLLDNESDPSSLVNYEYSLTGAFAGEQLPMSAAVSDPAHSGVSGLSASPTGVAHTFVWDAQSDLGNVYNNSIYIRLRANDGIVNSNYVVTPLAITVDYVVPVITNVLATQLSNSSDVQISYDVFDNTASNILVELQISSDGGLTWNVPTNSATGDIGATVSSGNGKTITWYTSTDYPDQEKNNMVVRLRAKDSLNNQSDYSNSIDFVLDNKAPVIATPTDLLAQPLAGATTVLVGGSFSENNPNTNDFYVAIDGGSYGALVAGDSDTATPADKSLPVGTTLKGNNYISSVKIVHTDDFNHVTNNENTSPNTAYKYAKPFTPSAPTISNPGESSLDVTINKNLNEVDGLEYAIFESSQNAYVQSDGSLSGSPYWQPIGIVTVTGLSQPISQYSFSVKSRNISDTSNAITSESDLSSSASSDYQSPNLSITSVAQTTDGTKYVIINYVGSDHQNAINNLVKYEYSLNNTDWQTMTEKSGVGSAGIVDLAFTSVGANLVFAWDVGVDLPNVEDSAVYIRLQSNDAITNSNIVTSPAFVVNTAGPIISNIISSQTLNSDSVTVTYDLADGAGANNTVVFSASDDSGATYNVATSTASGDVAGNITAGLAKSFTWNVGVNVPNQEKNSMRVKLVAIDSYGNLGEPVESSDFVVDTKVPEISAVTAAQQVGSALVTVNYNLSDISTSSVSFEVSSDSGLSWTIATTTVTGEIGDDQNSGSKVFNWNAVTDFPDQELDTMRIRVKARDVFGHNSEYVSSEDFSINTKILSISNITVLQNIGAKTFAIHYAINKTATVTLDISLDGGVSWEVATTTLSGAIGGVTAGNKTVSWNAGIDLNNEEKNSMRIRLSGTDSSGTVSPYYESDNFSLDTASPLGLLALSKFASTDTSVTLNWSAGIADMNFNHYELWYGNNQSDVINRNGTALKWSVANDSNLSLINTISTVITGITLNNDLYVKIWAIDGYNNETTVSDLNVYTAPTLINYTLEIQTPDGFGSTNPNTGNHIYIQDTNAQITAIASTSWAFDRWVVDNLLSDTSNPLTLFMNATRTLKAVFVESTIPVVENISTGSGSGDTTPPNKPILSPVKTPTNLTTVIISGLADPQSYINLYDNEVFVARLENVADQDGQFGQEFTFTEGNHILTVKAFDNSNNFSDASDSVNLNVKIKAPNAPVVLSPQNNSQVNDANPVLVGVSESLSKVEIVLDENEPVVVEANIDGAWQFRLPADLSLSEGVHTFVLKAIDLAGNESSDTILTLNKVTLPISIEVVSSVTPSTVSPIGGVTVPTVSGPASVLEPLSPAELIREDVVALELPGVPVPEVTSVNVVTGNDVFTFSGKALPNQEVLVYVHSDQALIYRAKADVNGVWQVNHLQSEIELSPGEHSIYAVAVDPEAKIKSRPGTVNTFTVSKNFFVSMFERLNLQTTIVTLVAVLFSMIWLYQVKKQEIVRV